MRYSDPPTARASISCSSAAPAVPPERPLPAALSGLDKNLCRIDEDLEHLEKSLAFILEPRAVHAGDKLLDAAVGPPVAPAVLSIREMEARAGRLAERIREIQSRLPL